MNNNNKKKKWITIGKEKDYYKCNQHFKMLNRNEKKNIRENSLFWTDSV